MSTLHSNALPIQTDISSVYDQIRVMRLQERSAYKCYDYISQRRALSSEVKCIDEQCRIKMCEWCYQVSDFCGFQRETVSVAISYLDRYLCTTQGQSALEDGNLFQLAAMTALYIAVKTQETVVIGIDLLTQLSRGTYSEEEFEQMEVQMLSALQWRVNGPTPHSFISCYMSLMPKYVDPAVSFVVMDHASHLVDLATCEYDFVDCLPSKIALGAVFNAISGISENLLSSATKDEFFRIIEHFSGLCINDALPVNERLTSLLRGGYSETLVEQINQTARKQSSSHCNSPVSVLRKGLTQQC